MLLEPRRLRPRRSGTRGSWCSTLHTPDGRSGTVSFVIPFRATKLQADVQDGRRSAGGGPLLYREWTLRGRLDGTALVERPRFRLVLQGRGNACMTARDFRSWILIATGPKTSFTLYGRFARPAS
jgi:hypothetical protein